MLREVWHRLGFGYLLLLPTLCLIGAAVQSGMLVVCFQIDPIYRDATGRGIDDSTASFAPQLHWLVKHPPSILVLFVLPWWAGAWALLRSEARAPLHDYWKVVFAVSNGAVLIFSFFVSWSAAILRGLCMMDYSKEPRSLLLDGVLVVLFSFVILAFLSALRLRTKTTPPQ